MCGPNSDIQWTSAEVMFGFNLNYCHWWPRGGAVGSGTAIPDGVIGIFHWHDPSGRAVSLELTQPLTEMSTRNISWGSKGARCVGLTTFMRKLSRNLAAWTSWNPQRLSRPVMGLIYLSLSFISQYWLKVSRTGPAFRHAFLYLRPYSVLILSFSPSPYSSLGLCYFFPNQKSACISLLSLPLKFPAPRFHQYKNQVTWSFKSCFMLRCAVWILTFRKILSLKL